MRRCRYFNVMDVLSKRPNGIRLHVMDVFCDELVAACPEVCRGCMRVWCMARCDCASGAGVANARGC